MRNVILSLMFIILSIKTHANETEFFHLIEKYVANSNKPVLVFYDLQWCPGSTKYVKEKEGMLKQFESCYNILFVTTNPERNAYGNVRIDSIIDLRLFFPYQLSSPKERKTLARLYSKHYHVKTKQYFHAPSAYNLLDKNKSFFFFNYYLPNNYEIKNCVNLK